MFTIRPKVSFCLCINHKRTAPPSAGHTGISSPCLNIMKTVIWGIHRITQVLDFCINFLFSFTSSDFSRFNLLISVSFSSIIVFSFSSVVAISWSYFSFSSWSSVFCSSFKCLYLIYKQIKGYYINTAMISNIAIVLI